MNITRLARLNLQRKPATTAVAVIGLALMVSLAGILMTLNRAVNEGVMTVDPDVNVIIGPKKSALELYLGGLLMGDYHPDLRNFNFMMEDSLKDDVAPRHFMPVARFASYGRFPAMGVTGEFLERPEGLNPPKVRQGRWFVEGAKEAVVGYGVARHGSVRLDGNLTLFSDIRDENGRPYWTGDYTVVGVLERKGHVGDNTIYVPLTDARAAYRAAAPSGLYPAHYAHEGITHLLVSLDPAVNAQWQRLYQIFEVKRAEQVVYVSRVQERIADLLNISHTAAWAVAALILLLAFATGSNLFNERFESMKRDLGIYRALGFSRLRLAVGICLEALMVVVAAVLLGGLLELLLWRPLLQSAGPVWVVLPAIWDTGHLSLWGAMILTAALAAALPLLRLYRWDAHESLRAM